MQLYGLVFFVGARELATGHGRGMSKVKARAGTHGREEKRRIDGKDGLRTKRKREGAKETVKVDTSTS